MLIELAEESSTPSSASFCLRSEAKIFLTVLCTSSKLPSTAATATLRPSWVAICRYWMSLTLPCG